MKMYFYDMLRMCGRRMILLSITAEEFGKLMDFATFINKDYISFIRNVGYGLSTFFGYPLTVYTVFDVDYKGNTYVDRVEGHTIYPEGLKQYQDHLWKSDLFVQRVTGIRQGSMQNRVITIPDIATYDEFYATDYGKYLKQINTPYQAILRAMRGHLHPLHVLSVFKTTEQGDFTEHERELLAAIDRIFGESVEHYLRFLSERYFWYFLQDESAEQDHKLAIVDEHGEVVFYNPEFVHLASECFDLHGTDSYVRRVREELWQQKKIELFHVSEPVSVHVDDFTLTVTRHSYTLASRERKFFFLRIDRGEKHEPKRKTDQEAKSILRLVDAYGLTTREAELAVLLPSGMNNGELAERFHISVPTVKFHLQNIRRKLNVQTRAEIIAIVTGQS